MVTWQGERRIVCIFLSKEVKNVRKWSLRTENATAGIRNRKYESEEQTKHYYHFLSLPHQRLRVASVLWPVALQLPFYYPVRLLLPSWPRSVPALVSFFFPDVHFFFPSTISHKDKRTAERHRKIRKRESTQKHRVCLCIWHFHDEKAGMPIKLVRLLQWHLVYLN